jgi:predicted protein tyrosine phosphatase
VDAVKIKEFYRGRGITEVINVPINDMREEDFIKGLFDASVAIDHLINEKDKKVYVHCTSSITRSPSAVITYLCLFMRASDWKNPQRVAALVKDFHKIAHPNMVAIQKTLILNNEF